MTCPRGVTFDGTNDWLSRGAGLSGLADGRFGSMAFIVRVGANGATYRILQSDNNGVRVRRATTNTINVQILGTGAEVFNFSSSITVLADGNYHRVQLAWNTNFSAGNKLAHIRIDGVVDTSLSINDGSAAFDIDYTAGDWFIGSSTAGGSELLAGDLARFWFAPQYVDFSAVDIGINGEIPPGVTAVVDLNGPAAGYATNLGTGGNFTVTGTLTDAADDPPCEGASMRVPGQFDLLMPASVQ